MDKPRLLFVDDDAAIRETLPPILNANGFEVTAVGTVSEALSEINRQQFDILLSDLNIGHAGDGFIVVGAMRRLQPEARTYILTGYPDFASALEALRSQVDDYLIKPANVTALLKTLATKLRQARVLNLPGKRCCTVIREHAGTIIEKWADETERDPQLKALNLSRASRIDHLPGLLRQLADRLEDGSDPSNREAVESAAEHGRTRRQQRYPIPLIVAETRVLYRVIADTVQDRLAEMDISSIIPDMVLISDNLSEMLAESLRSFLSTESMAA